MGMHPATGRFPGLKRIASALCLLGLVLAGGCQKAGDAAAGAAIRTVTGHDVDIRRDGNTTILRSPDGAEARISSGSGLSLPAGFPEDVYLPGEYTLSSVAEMGPMTMVQLSTTVPVDALYAKVDQSMQAGGWKQVMQMRQASGSAVLAYEKGERRTSFTLSSGDNGGRTLVGLQMQAQDG